MLSTGTCRLVCNFETTQAAFVARVAQTQTHVRVRVNMDPVFVVCREPERIYREIDCVLALTAGHKNCLLGTGALPLETPPENVRLIREPLAKPTPAEGCGPTTEPKSSVSCRPRARTRR